ncbi:hypothetical protein ABW19_dt0205559 [Dactylella cylindrospora]|nr:hypothetical protein ABW19_dt0205559 [Dactylella cylindrospora]
MHRKHRKYLPAKASRSFFNTATSSSWSAVPSPGGDDGGTRKGTVKTKPEMNTPTQSGSTKSLEGDKWLLNSLNDEFTDVVVLVGPSKEKFNLHRSIICSRSTFFKAACKETFREGQSREIKLPELDVEAFKLVVNWMYGGGYRLEAHDVGAPAFGGGLSSVKPLLDSADFLGLHQLKKDVIDQYCAALEKLGPFLNPEDRNDVHHLFISKTFRDAQVCDWEHVKRVTDIAVKRFVFRPDTVQGLLREEEGDYSVFFAALALSYADRFQKRYCSSCRRELPVSLSGSSMCSDCVYDDVYGDPEYPPPWNRRPIRRDSLDGFDRL